MFCDCHPAAVAEQSTSDTAHRMNGRQIASVAFGMVVFLVGVVLGLRTLAGGLVAEPWGTLVVAGVVSVLGIAVALLGAYVTRDPR